MVRPFNWVKNWLNRNLVHIADALLRLVSVLLVPFIKFKLM